MLRYLVRLYRYDFFDFDTDTENCMLLPIFRFKSTDTSKLAHRHQNQWGKGARAPQKFVHRGTGMSRSCDQNLCGASQSFVKMVKHSQTMLTEWLL